MPTTPGGRFSPGDSDDWDLTTDLAAMQVSNETATANEIAAAITTGLSGIAYRSGTNGDRIALSGASLVAGMRFQTTDNGGFEWINPTGTSSGWRISPGQTLATGQFNSNPTTGGALIGAIISTIVLPVGQRLRVTSGPIGLALTGVGAVNYRMVYRNSATDVSNSVFDKDTTVRGYIPATGGNVFTVPGTTFEVTTTVAAKASAALYTGAGSVYNVDGQSIRIESI